MGKLLRFIDADYIHFITTKTQNRVSLFNNKKNCLILLKIINILRNQLKFKLLGYVIMPDHLHLLIKPSAENSYNVSYIMMMIKGCSAREINIAEAKPSASRTEEIKHLHKDPTRLGEGLALPDKDPTRLGEGLALPDKDPTRLGEGLALPDKDPTRLGEGLASPREKTWQKSFYDFPIYSDKKFKEKLNYIHNNPLKTCLVDNLDNYLWSSYQNYYLNNNTLITINYLDD